MKFDNIVSNLAKDEVISINNGEVIINKKIKSVIGGVPVYNILVSFPVDGHMPIEFESIDELDDFSIINDKGLDLRRCLACGDLPEEGYYHDEETGNYYCCIDCLKEWMDKVHSQWNWNIITEALNILKFMVKIDEKEVVKYKDAVKENNDWWRPYKIVYHPPYDNTHCSFEFEG